MNLSRCNQPKSPIKCNCRASFVKLNSGCSSDPVGISDRSVILDQRFSASSTHSASNPHDGRLTGSNAWFTTGCLSTMGNERFVNRNVGVTASSELDNSHKAGSSRLYSTNSWCSAPVLLPQYLQFNIGKSDYSQWCRYSGR